MEEIWASLCENKVLLSPGSYFTPWQGKGAPSTEERGGDRGVGYFRVAFSIATVCFPPPFLYRGFIHHEKHSK